MSIVATAIRICAVKALLSEGATLAGSRVFDSVAQPVDSMTQNDPLPFIVVSTGADVSQIAGADINAGDRDLELIFDFAVARIVSLPSGDGMSVEIADCDGTRAVALSILHRQIMQCLFGRGGDAWGDAFRSLMGVLGSVTDIPVMDAKDGVALASRQMVFAVRPVAEPNYKDPVLPDRSGLALFFDAMDTDPLMTNVAAALRNAVFGRPVGWPDVIIADAVMGGVLDDAARIIGLAPVADGVTVVTGVGDIVVEPDP